MSTARRASYCTQQSFVKGAKLGVNSIKGCLSRRYSKKLKTSNSSTHGSDTITIKTMTTINRELFEAWLFSQPREREFVYINGLSDEEPGCVVCSFLRETTNIKRFAVGDTYMNIYKGESTDYDAVNLPTWLNELHLASLAGTPTFGAVQDHYLQLFPNTLDGLFNQSQTEGVTVSPQQQRETAVNSPLKTQ